MRTIGPYEIQSELGRGATGVVYCARQPSLNRDVALKVLAKELASDPAYVARFHREAEMASSLEHPGIVPIYDTGEADGVHYIAMRYVRGVTLEEATLKRKPDLEAAVGVCRQIADALAYAHGKGIIHRDLKPSNVLLTPDGHMALADFGIARAVQNPSQTQAGQILGTPEYMSPEQIRGEPVDARSDIYSLGMILYFLLAGKPAFTGGDTLSVLYRQANHVPTPIQELNPAVTPTLSDLVHRCLAKDPASRYPNARELRVALDAAVAAVDTAATATGSLLELPPGKELAALSLDMVRSTMLKEQRSEQVLATLFGDFRALVNRCCQESGSLAHTWSGDGVVALFPGAESAVRAATAIQRALPRFNRDRGQDGARAIRARSGVDIGEIPWRSGEPLGEVTSRTLDVAAKLQKAAQPGEVVASWTAFSRLDNRAGFLPGPKAGPLAGAYCWTEWQEQQDVRPPEPSPEPPVSPGVSTQLQATLAMQSLSAPREGAGAWPRLMGAGVALAVLAAIIWFIATGLAKPVAPTNKKADSGTKNPGSREVKKSEVKKSEVKKSEGGSESIRDSRLNPQHSPVVGVPLALPTTGELTWVYLESPDENPANQKRVTESLTPMLQADGAPAARLSSTDPSRPPQLARMQPDGLVILGFLAPDGRTPLAAFSPPYRLLPNPLPDSTPLKQAFTLEGRNAAGQSFSGTGTLEFALTGKAEKRTVPAGTMTAHPFKMVEEQLPAGGIPVRTERKGWFAPDVGIIQEEQLIATGRDRRRLLRQLESKSF